MEPIYYIIITPFIIILLAILYLIIKNYNTIDYFANYIRDINNSKHFNDYIKLVNKKMYNIKIQNLKPGSDFKNEYIKNIMIVNPKFNTILNKSVTKCNKLTKSIPVFKKYKWNFLMSKSTLELDMPFTLHDSIILPRNLLNDTYLYYIRNNRISDQFINLLLHEKIHIIQRFNQDKFNNIYPQLYPFVNRMNFDKNLNHTTDNHMNNPDSNNTIWIYRIDNLEYNTFLQYNGGNLKSVGKRLDNNGEIDLDKIRSKYGISNDVSMYHPNEIFACIAAKSIENKIPKTDEIRFLRLLK